MMATRTVLKLMVCWGRPGSAEYACQPQPTHKREALMKECWPGPWCCCIWVEQGTWLGACLAVIHVDTRAGRFTESTGGDQAV